MGYAVTQKGQVSRRSTLMTLPRRAPDPVAHPAELVALHVQVVRRARLLPARVGGSDARGLQAGVPGGGRVFAEMGVHGILDHLRLTPPCEIEPVV
jgi:hypothetical protein